MRRFLEAERERIAGLGDSEDGWQDWCGHYRALSPEEQAVTRYLLTAAGKAEEAEDRLEEEFEIEEIQEDEAAAISTVGDLVRFLQAKID